MAIPKSTDKKINKIGQVLKKFANKENITFCFEGEEISLEEVFSASGFLTLFLADAKELYEKVANGLYTHKELMEPISGATAQKAKKARKMPQELFEAESAYLASQPTPYRFPILFVQKDKTYVSAVPFVDPKKKAAMLTLTGFAVESLLEYAKTYKNDKSLLIDGMVPIEPLFDKISMDIQAKKIKIHPKSMLAELEGGNVNTVEVNPENIPEVTLRQEQEVLQQAAQKAKEPVVQQVLSDEDKDFASQIDSLF